MGLWISFCIGKLNLISIETNHNHFRHWKTENNNKSTDIGQEENPCDRSRVSPQKRPRLLADSVEVDVAVLALVAFVDPMALQAVVVAFCAVFSVWEVPLVASAFACHHGKRLHT